MPNTASVGSGMGGLSRANTAILRVAYLIAASDRDVNQGERDVFKKTICALQGLEMGNDETSELIVEVAEDARKFSILRDFYSEEELIATFRSKVSKDIVAIQGNNVDCRKAFAIWISICMADKEYSDFERKLIKALQATINDLWGLCPIPIFPSMVMASALGKPKKYGQEARIPDAFLEEVEERCREIDEAQTQLADSADEEERMAVENSLNYLVESFRDFIVNVGE